MNRVYSFQTIVNKWISAVVMIILFMMITLSPGKIYATHAAGADLTYTSLGGLTYRVTATFYRDCGGTPEPGNITISYKSVSCGYARTALAIKDPSSNGEEITMMCSSAVSSCNGGISTGIQKWVYSTVITLPMACSDWVFSYRICCRNCTITTIQTPCAANSEIYIEAKLNNTDAPGNNSPFFSTDPVAFVCLGQNFNYNQGVIDPDGDSLYYELITPKISATGEVTWIGNATTQSPLASSTPFTINPVTGDINFTPSVLEIGILAIRVNEFRNGIFIGSTIRDMQVYIQNCYNSLPSLSGINNSTNFTINACLNQQLCFDIHTADNDLNQSVSIQVINSIPGAVVSQSQGSRPALTVCWTPTASQVSEIPYILTVMVYDNACPLNGVQLYSYSVYVKDPAFSITTQSPACFGTSAGSATVLSQQQGNYTYLWSTNPAQTTATATGLQPGSYSVTVTDQSGCTFNLSTTVNAAPPALQVSLNTVSLPDCANPLGGSVTGSVTGGTLPYSYLWNNGSVSSTLINAGFGTYTLTVTDKNGCTASSSVTLSPSAGNALNATAIVGDVNCYGGNNGSISVTASGGNSPYNFIWNTNATAGSINNLTAGAYTVTVSDQKGCSIVKSWQITQPANPVNAIVTVHPVSCAGNSDGGIIIQPNGGTSPYNFLWNTGVTSNNITQKAAGTYTVTVTDSKGCSYIIHPEITQPPILHLSGVVDHVSCNDGSDGSILLNINGGTPGYDYLWSNGSTGNNLSGIPAGSYSATVTDSKGCTSTESFTITEPATPLTVSITQILHISCLRNLGSINVEAVGGVAPYSYLWSNGSNLSNISNLAAGTYTLTVTDQSGCDNVLDIEILTRTNAVTIPEPLVQHVLCYNGNNGSVNISPAGGFPPYQYLWSNGSTSEDLQNISGGIYTITVTDVNGCSGTKAITVNQPMQPLIPVLNITNVECYGQQNGVIEVTVNGGTAPYSYNWSNGSTTASLEGLAPGSYTITITDQNGCNAMISGEVTQPSSAMMINIDQTGALHCDGTGAVQLNGNATGGMQPYTYSWSTGAATQSININAGGNFTLSITDLNGCMISSSVNILQPAANLILKETVVNADCLRGNMGSVSVEVTGGSEPYKYLWNTGSTTNTVNELTAGVYTISVTDKNGCSVVKSFTISDKSVLPVNASGNTIICAGQTVTLFTDSINDVSYQWYYNEEILPGATGHYFITPAAGWYYVQVVSGCGTFKSDEIEILVNSVGNTRVSSNKIICPGQQVQLSADGGKNYHWNPAVGLSDADSPEPVASPLETTTYSVTITDDYGCSTVLDVTVAVLCDTLQIPTGFSPNGDGTNDGYVIDGVENYPGNKLWIYNQWGNLVYKTKNYNNKWDGVSNVTGFSGKKVFSGTYYYILDLNDGSKPRAGYLIIRRGQ